MCRSLCLLALATACSGKGDTTAEGEVAGQSLAVASAWWGGPFVVIADQDYDCLDMSWVNRYHEEEEAAVDEDMMALQVTWNGDTIEPSLYDIAGEAALTVRLLTVSDGFFSIDKGRSGTVVIDQADDEGQLVGTYEIAFTSGTLSGALDMDWCANLKG